MKEKRVCAILCILMMLFMMCSTATAQGVLYPHPAVETELTKEEGTVRAASGRRWKAVTGEVRRQDMEHGELRYEVYLPENYDSTKLYPLVLFLHGGSIGYLRSNGHTPWTNQLTKYSENFYEAMGECIIFAPQAPGAVQSDSKAIGAYWSEMPTGLVGTEVKDNSAASPYLMAVEKMLSDFLEEGIPYGENLYKIDQMRLYVTGHSMGGIGTYTILRDCPDVFAAAIIGAGIGDPDSVEKWRNTKVRILHGTEDRVIPYKSTETMEKALGTAKNAEIIALEGMGHDIQSFMYALTDVGGRNENLVWMAAQKFKEQDSARYMLWILIAVVAGVAVIAGAIWVLKRRKLKS